MNEIIALNNTAIAYLQTGNVRKACNTMTEASNAFIRATSTTENETAAASTTGSGRQQQHRQRRHRDTTITWTKIESSPRYDENNGNGKRRHDNKNDNSSGAVNRRVRITHDCCSFDDGQSPTIYPYAPTLLKPCCQAQFKPDQVRRCCEVCRDDSGVCPSNIAPVLRYNVALCCQLLGSKLLDEGADSREGLFYFDQATRLYEKVHGSCWSPRLNLSRQSPGLLTMKMAVVNNQAAIYYESGKPEACAGAMRNLSETLASIPRSFLCGRWGTFRLNVMVVDALSQRPPAAAA